MKSMILPVFLCIGSAACAATLTFTDNTVRAIPDGSSAGLTASIPVTAPLQMVTGVEVDVQISATTQGSAFLGDLYIYLTDGTNLAILLNRAGRASGMLGGYSDNQSIAVTFSTLGAADVHHYRLLATGSDATPLSGPLTGIWEPDGRLIDPSSVLASDARTAGLEVFNGAPATGTWGLFAADISSGGTHQIESWTLRITTIPEPATTALMATAALMTLLRRRRD